MDDILVSISCITYNHEKYIEEALKGFLMQKTNFRYEILIHDDASTDKTAEIIKKYEKQYPELIKPIYQKENQFSKGIKRITLTYNANRALGKYIALCEGDDYWTDPYKLQKQVDYMEKHNDCSFSCHSAKRVSVESLDLHHNLGLPGKNDKILRFEDFANRFVATASKVYRKDVLKDLPEWFFQGEAGDFPMQLLLLDRGYAYYINETLSAYRVGVPGSSNDRLKKSDITRKKYYFEERIKIYQDFDKYSCYKHHESIERFIVPLQANIIQLETDRFSRLKKLQGLKKTGVFKSLQYKDICKTYCRVLFPWIYGKMAKAIRYF